ncbi:hypothetical protein NQ317_001985 [Molorchus minor]|uniref:Uncharacterized protein n=1 Tax=Molorchus minor TaxID=1323400 RepID=A0ABQ9JHJ0_9CUCU|nr:hypothetical protein NQ317_001985 [Molorchus minor]
MNIRAIAVRGTWFIRMEGRLRITPETSHYFLKIELMATDRITENFTESFVAGLYNGVGILRQYFDVGRLGFLYSLLALELVLGFGIPVKLGTKQSMAVGWNFQFQYADPTNITALRDYPPVVSSRSREKREIQKSDRSLFYKGLENILNRKWCLRLYLALD